MGSNGTKHQLFSSCLDPSIAGPGLWPVAGRVWIYHQLTQAQVGWALQKQSLESRSQPKIGGIDRSEGTLSPKKWTKSKDWEEACSIDQKEEVKVKRPTMEKVSKWAQRGTGSHRMLWTMTEATCPLLQKYLICVCSAPASLEPVNTTNSDPIPSPLNHPPIARARQGGAPLLCQGGWAGRQKPRSKRKGQKHTGFLTHISWICLQKPRDRPPETRGRPLEVLPMQFSEEVGRWQVAGHKWSAPL